MEHDRIKVKKISLFTGDKENEVFVGSDTLVKKVFMRQLVNFAKKRNQLLQVDGFSISV
jgi:hypothetical protein